VLRSHVKIALAVLQTGNVDRLIGWLIGWLVGWLVG